MGIDWSKTLGSGGKPGVAPSPVGTGNINWGAALAQPYAGTSLGPAGPNAQEQKVIKSFQSLTADSRKSSLTRLQAAANGGDATAKRKLELLVPLADKNVPKNQDYTDKSVGGYLYRAGEFGVKNLLAPAIDAALGSSNQTAGEVTTRGARGNVTNVQAGRENNLRDQSVDALRARLMVAGGTAAAGAKAPMAILKAGNKAGLANAGVMALDQTNSGRVGTQSAGEVAKNVAKEGAVGYGVGFGFGAGGKGAELGGSKLVRALADQVRPVSTATRVNASRAAGDVLTTRANAQTAAKSDALVGALNERIAKNGLLRGVEVHSKTTDTLDRNIQAPTTVDPTTRTLRVNPKVLQEDLNHLATGKGIQLPSGEVLRKSAGESTTGVQGRYLDELVKFEESHVKNATIGDMQGMRSGEVTGQQLDQRAIQNAGGTAEALQALKANPNRAAELTAEGKTILGSEAGSVGLGGKNKPTPAMAELQSKVVSGLPKQPRVDLIKGKVAQAGSQAKAQLLDRYAPIKSLSDAYQKATGKPLPIENDPYGLARLHAGTAEIAAQRVEDLGSLIREAPDMQALKDIGVAQRILTDRSGIKNPISQETAQRVIDDYKQKLGPDDFAKTQETVGKVIAYHDTMLKELTDNGIISKEAYDAIKAKNQNYFSKFDVVDHLLDNSNGLAKGKSFNVAKQDLIKSQQGTEGKIADPIEATIRQTIKGVDLINRNKVGQAIGRMADSLPENNGLLIKLRSAESVQERIKLYGENKELAPVRHQAERLAIKYAGQLRSLQAGIRSIEGELTKAVRRDTATEVTKKGLVDAIPAARNLSTPAAKEIVANLVDMGENVYARIRGKLQTRDAKTEPLLREIDALRTKASDIKNAMAANRDAAGKLRDQSLPVGYEKLSYFKDGIKEEVAIPTDIGEALKHLTSQQADFVTKAMSTTGNLLRKGATSLNAGFALVSNPIRDVQSLALNSKYIKANPISLGIALGKGFASALGQGKLYREFIASGGGQSTFFGRQPEKITDLAKSIEQSTAQKIGRTITSPKDLFGLISAIEKAGQVTELTPRLAEFGAAKKAGASGAQAAFDARNVTVDFSQAGTVGQVMNQWVPFLNARLQGNVKSFEAIGRNPGRAALVAGYTVAVPVISTYMWNQKNFNDVYQQIPSYVKDMNFVLIYGRNKDDSGNFTDVVKIPKGDLGRVFGNTLESFLDFATGHAGKNLGQVAGEAISNASPIDFMQDGKFSPTTALGGVLPPLVKAGVEAGTNYSFFKGGPVVPQSLQGLPNNEQVKPNTSKLAVELAKLTGQSPLKVENTVQNVTGGLTKQVESPQAFGKSITGRVSGAPGSNVTNQFYNVLNETTPLRNSASKQINEALKAGDDAKAKKIASDYNKTLDQKFTGFQRQYGKYMGDDLKKSLEKQRLDLNPRNLSARKSAIKKKP